MIKKYFFFFLFILSLCSLVAQNKDAQLWENINMEKNINPRLVFRVIQQGRITQNYSSPNFNDFDIGFNYKINKHFHAAAAYVWVEKKAYNSNSWRTRHQAYVDVTFRKKIKGFLFCDRQMFSWQVHDYSTSEKGKIPDYYLRNKVTIRYEKNFKITPYIASEIYFPVNAIKDNWEVRFNKVRYFTGVFYRPSLINEFEVYYMIEDHFNIRNPPMYFVIGLGYTHVF